MTNSSATNTGHSSGIFRGWYVVVGGFLNSMLLIGATIYSFGLFVNPVEAEFGLGREQVNLGYLAFLIGFAVWAPIVGKLLEKFDVRLISTVGSISFAAGMIAISMTYSAPVIGLLLLAPVAFGVVAAGAFTANTVVTRWFTMKRGQALGIVAIASSAGGFAITPLFALVVGEFGWRPALAIMGVIIGVAAVAVAVLFLRDRPSDFGIRPDGETEHPTSASLADETPLTSKQILGMRNFWLVAVGVGLLLGSDQAILTSLVPYGIDRGFTMAEASFLVSAMTGSAILGKLVLGWLCDRVDKRYLFLFVVACNLAFLAVLILQPGYTQLLVAASVIGLAIGGVYPVWTSLTADCFGSASFGIAYGLMNIVAMPCALISVTLAGRSFDQTGSYDFAFWTFIGLDILAAILVFALRLQPGSSRKVVALSTK